MVLSIFFKKQSLGGANVNDIVFRRSDYKRPLGFFWHKSSVRKKGTMDSYETTTTGKAFEALFDETKWKAFESKKG